MLFDNHFQLVLNGSAVHILNVTTETNNLTLLPFNNEVHCTANNYQSFIDNDTD